MGELELKLREALKILQDAHNVSYSYPNPYSGIPSPLTKAIMNGEQWVKKAISEVVADDIDTERGGRRVNPLTANTGLQVTDETRD